jgi:hypothetical protein
VKIHALKLALLWPSEYMSRDSPTCRGLASSLPSWLYLAVVLDLFTRKIVGWAMRGHMRAELTIAALWQKPPPGLIHHSDRGSQYAAGGYRKLLSAAGMIQSMSHYNRQRLPNRQSAMPHNPVSTKSGEGQLPPTFGPWVTRTDVERTIHGCSGALLRHTDRPLSTQLCFGD